jgi:hypothetical protein
VATIVWSSAASSIPSITPLNAVNACRRVTCRGPQRARGAFRPLVRSAETGG